LDVAGVSLPAASGAPTILVDADACPVKNEVYRVAQRCALKVVLVANAPMRIPEETWIEFVVVGGRFDASDDWIESRVVPGDIVITADIPLAARCLKKGAAVLGHKGREFTEENIGAALATRAILSDLRDSGEIRRGPPPFEKKDRSAFLQQLDTIIQRLKRSAREPKSLI
jgi:hypothetical protein